MKASMKFTLLCAIVSVLAQHCAIVRGESLSCRYSLRRSGLSCLRIAPSTSPSQYKLFALSDQSSSLPADLSVKKTRKWYAFAFSGMLLDIQRRIGSYGSDWSDGFENKRKSFSTICFMYFACLAPTVAFGGITNIITKGQMGVTHFIASCGISGILYAIFSGQPLTILGPTGLTLAFIGSLYSFTSQFGLPFMAMYSWTGIWTSLFLALAAILNMSNLIKYCTRFTDDCFNALIAMNFLFEACRSLGVNFTKGSEYLTSAFAASNLAVITWFLTKTLVKFKNKKLFNEKIRKIISDFGPSAVIVMVSLFAALPSVKGLGMDYLSVPTTNTFSSILQTTNLMAVPMEMRLLAIGPAILLTMLFFLDQNISVRAVNAFKLKKGEAYHWDLFVLSGIVGLLSLVGLPWTCAATVQSVNHVRALSDVETLPNGEEVFTNTIETRITGLSIHALVLSSLLLLPLLANIPMCVISGIFLFLGRKCMKGNLFLDRIMEIISEKSLLCNTSAFNQLPRNTVLKYLGIQGAALGVIWTLKQSAQMSLLFPSCIAMLMLIRTQVLPKVFKEEELVLLDPP